MTNHETKPVAEDVVAGDALSPPNIKYARHLVENLPTINRVQQALPGIPPAVVQMMKEQPDAFLYGAVTAVQIAYDLKGLDVLDILNEIGKTGELDERTKALAHCVLDFLATLESVGYVVCRELVQRDDETQNL